MFQHFRRKQATCKCQELRSPGKQTGRSMHVRTYVRILLLIRTLIGTYVLGVLLCAGVIALCCAVLCSRFNDNITHGRTYNCSTTAVVAVYRYSVKEKVHKMKVRGHAVRKTKCSKARHNTAQRGTARQRTAGRDTARGTARCCAAPLS